MKNLSGNRDCDYTIAWELGRAGIEIVRLDSPRQAEVPASFVGRLGPFEFTRRWTYWVVRGPVPLHAAREMYADSEGCKYVRVAGHCGCPSPDEWANRYDATGNRIVLDPDGKRRAAYAELVRRWEMPPDETFVSTREEVEALTVRAFIDVYHIDTQEGAESVRGDHRAPRA